MATVGKTEAKKRVGLSILGARLEVPARKGSHSRRGSSLHDLGHPQVKGRLKACLWYQTLPSPPLRYLCLALSLHLSVSSLPFRGHNTLVHSLMRC